MGPVLAHDDLAVGCKPLFEIQSGRAHCVPILADYVQAGKVVCRKAGNKSARFMIEQTNVSAASTGIRVEDEQLGWTRHLPLSWQDYALLARLDRPIGTWLLLIPCWWGLTFGDWPFRFDLAILFAIGAVAMRGAGCTINDLADRKFDAQVERTRNRPLASGRLSVTQALIFLALQLAIGLVVLLLIPRAAQIVALASVPLIVIYPFMKRITYWPQAFLGITFNWGVLVGCAAVTGTVTWPALCLYLAGIAWTLGYDTIYAHQDKEDDLLVGVKSSALRLGSSTLKALWGFYATTMVLIAGAMLASGIDAFWLVLLIAPTAHLVWQIRTLDIDGRANCLERFRSNRTAGLLILLVLAIGQFYR